MINKNLHDVRKHIDNDDRPFEMISVDPTNPGKHVLLNAKVRIPSISREFT